MCWGRLEQGYTPASDYLGAEPRPRPRQAPLTPTSTTRSSQPGLPELIARYGINTVRNVGLKATLQIIPELQEDSEHGSPPVLNPGVCWKVAAGDRPRLVDPTPARSFSLASTPGEEAEEFNYRLAGKKQPGHRSSRYVLTTAIKRHHLSYTYYDGTRRCRFKSPVGGTWEVNNDEPVGGTFRGRRRPCELDQRRLSSQRELRRRRKRDPDRALNGPRSAAPSVPGGAIASGLAYALPEQACMHATLASGGVPPRSDRDRKVNSPMARSTKSQAIRRPRLTPGPAYDRHPTASKE